MPNPLAFTGVKVFSATKAAERESLGERITSWMREVPRVEIVHQETKLSSDSEFHCLAIVLFYRAAA